jgi:hypothetical protein
MNIEASLINQQPAVSYPWAGKEIEKTNPNPRLARSISNIPFS